MTRGSLLRWLSSVLLITGAFLLVDAGVTLVWQEPLSALYARLQQDRLGGDLRSLERSTPSPAERRALALLPGQRRRIAFLARELRRTAAVGAAVGRIRIPRVHANYVVVNGTDTASLRKGPGIYDDTPFPGAGGTTAIAGHRTTYLAPFRHIDRLRRGDEVSLEMPYGRFTYSVEATKTVLPTAVWVIRRVRYDRLVLSACTPLYSASHRLVVFTKLVGVEPRGAAL